MGGLKEIAEIPAGSLTTWVTALVLGDLTVKVTEDGEPVVTDRDLVETLSAAVEKAWGQASLVPLVGDQFRRPRPA